MEPFIKFTVPAAPVWYDGIMDSNWSALGERLSAHSGILELMDDLGRALTLDPDMRMMGGGNPARVPAMERVWRERMNDLLADGDRYERMLAHYDPPAGSPAFLESLASMLRRTYGWPIGPENLAITAGGQTAFFFLFNLLAGKRGNRLRQIVFPLAPEYIGYAAQAAEPGQFRSCPALIRELEPHRFKYAVDFDRLEVNDDTAALCVSRPTNPSGNVLTDEEIQRLSERAAAHGTYLIVDGAYGMPFPGVIYTEVKPVWDDHMILTLSLSKLGLPGTRTGIVVAEPSIIRALGAMTANIGLANGNLGQALVHPMLDNGELIRLCKSTVLPFYREKSLQAQAWLLEALGDLPWSMHVSEGAFFLWLRFQDLPIPSAQLYERLKKRKVLVVPGEYFFFGLEEPWPHSTQCIRMTFTQDEEVVREGIGILADEVRKIYREG